MLGFTFNDYVQKLFIQKSPVVCSKAFLLYSPSHFDNWVIKFEQKEQTHSDI